MKYTLTVIYGMEQVLKIFNDLNFSQDEKDNNIKVYYFNSIEEKEAFIFGLNEMSGWLEFCIPELELTKI